MGRANACVGPARGGVDWVVMGWACVGIVINHRDLGFDRHSSIGPRLRSVASAASRLGPAWLRCGRQAFCWLCLPGVETPGYNIGRPLARTGDL